MNSDIEHIDYGALYEIGINLFIYSKDIKNSLNKIDSYIKSLNDDKVWKGQGRDSLVNHYLNERNNLNLLYLKLVNYSKSILKVVQDTEDFSRQAAKTLDSLSESSLWPV